MMTASHSSATYNEATLKDTWVSAVAIIGALEACASHAAPGTAKAWTGIAVLRIEWRP
jgi:hypothetical protein